MGGDLEDRITSVRGPNLGDEVLICERYGDWVRAAEGWLPLVVGRNKVLEIIDPTRANPRSLSSISLDLLSEGTPPPSAPSYAPWTDAERSRPSLLWTWVVLPCLRRACSFAVAKPELSICVISVCCVGSYVGLRMAAA